MALFLLMERQNVSFCLSHKTKTLRRDTGCQPDICHALSGMERRPHQYKRKVHLAHTPTRISVRIRNIYSTTITSVVRMASSTRSWIFSSSFHSE